ncbi:MAG: hemerythrin domain-containing protein [Rubrivivax sp.]|nr:hemerythrin domain-containing protein [Rubrivivax sp.]
MTTSPLTLHAAPAAGFDQPFEMLDACHQRVRRSLALLQRLERHLGERGADEQARQAAGDVLRYFDLAAPAHHEDEERHVLPVLRRLGEVQGVAGAAGPDLRQLAQRLHADHQRMAAAWALARPPLQALAEGEPWPAGQAEAICAHWQAFGALYEDHLVAEDEVAFPAAAAQADAASRRAMGQEMATRRGVRP